MVNDITMRATALIISAVTCHTRVFNCYRGFFNRKCEKKVVAENIRK